MDLLRNGFKYIEQNETSLEEWKHRRYIAGIAAK